MEDELYVVTAFDTGGVTGYSVIGVRAKAMHDPRKKILANIAFWKADEFYGDENSQTDEMISLVNAWEDAHIVMEDFLLRKFSTDREMLAPVRINARFEYGLHVHGDPRSIIYQPSDLAMATITDDRMIAIEQSAKGLAFHTGTRGKKDARDSIRHNLTWLRRAKQLLAVNDAMRGLA